MRCTKPKLTYISKNSMESHLQRKQVTELINMNEILSCVIDSSEEVSLIHLTATSAIPARLHCCLEHSHQQLEPE